MEESQQEEEALSLSLWKLEEEVLVAEAEDALVTAVPTMVRGRPLLLMLSFC